MLIFIMLVFYIFGKVATAATAIPQWLPVAGTLSGVLLTGLISLLAATLARRWQKEAAAIESLREIRKAVREDRISIYPKFLDKSRRLNYAIESRTALHLQQGVTPDQLSASWGTEFGDALNEFNESLNAVYLVGGEGVRHFAADLEYALLGNIRIRAFGAENAILPDIGDFERKLLDGMRRELTEPENDG